jgi:hypothetical protein
MMIISRQFYHYKTAKKEAYKNWVKTTFGAMHYEQKRDPTQFTFALEALADLLFFETDLDILEIHLQVSITSPKGANKSVLEYKQLIRTRIAALSPADDIMDLT